VRLPGPAAAGPGSSRSEGATPCLDGGHLIPRARAGGARVPSRAAGGARVPSCAARLDARTPTPPRRFVCL